MPDKEDKVDVILAIEGVVLTTNKMGYFSYKDEWANV